MINKLSSRDDKLTFGGFVKTLKLRSFKGHFFGVCFISHDNGPFLEVLIKMIIITERASKLCLMKKICSKH